MSPFSEPNWNTDCVLEWLTGEAPGVPARFTDRAEALRGIEREAEAGTIRVIAMDGPDGERLSVPPDDWCDLHLVFSEKRGYWFIAPHRWHPLDTAKVFREDVPIYAGVFTFADLEADQH